MKIEVVVYKCGCEIGTTGVVVELCDEAKRIFNEGPCLKELDAHYHMQECSAKT